MAGMMKRLMGWLEDVERRGIEKRSIEAAVLARSIANSPEQAPGRLSAAERERLKLEEEERRRQGRDALALMAEENRRQEREAQAARASRAHSEAGREGPAP